jgi:hypothetical protein
MTSRHSAGQAVAAEIDMGTAPPPASPMRKIILIACDHVILFVYHVLSDRFTPYTSQARVETFMTQVAAEVAGDVREVGVKDNSRVSRGQLLFRIDPSLTSCGPIRRSETCRLRCREQTFRSPTLKRLERRLISSVQILRRAAELNRIVTGLVTKHALAETQEFDPRPIRPRPERIWQKPRPIFNVPKQVSEPPASRTRRCGRHSQRSTRHASTFATPKFAPPAMGWSPICALRRVSTFPRDSPC